MSDIPLFKIKNLIYKPQLAYNHILIEKGKVNFIVGESGSGKSTLLKLLNNSISAESGELLYLDKPIETYDPIALRKEISLVSQEPFLFPSSIRDNFKTFYTLRQKPFPREDYIDYITQLCGVDVPLEQDTSTLSGGEKQRVYLSVFLSFCPKVLLLDEPTSALDEKTSLKVMDNIINFCREKGTEIIIVSHDTKIVDAFCENKIEIKKEG